MGVNPACSESMVDLINPPAKRSDRARGETGSADLQIVGFRAGSNGSQLQLPVTAAVIPYQRAVVYFPYTAHSNFGSEQLLNVWPAKATARMAIMARRDDVGVPGTVPEIKPYAND